jgi:hypothetical protein
MHKKFLIVSGCSWTDPEQLSEDINVSNDIVRNYNRWPNILADKLNMTLINYGKRASGNEYICSSLIDNITSMNKNKRDNIGLVIVAWSEAKRTDFEYKKNENDYYVKNIFEKRNLKRYDNNYVWDSILYTDPLRGDMYYKVKHSIRYMYLLQTFLKFNNIPYKMVQSIPLQKLSNLGAEFNLDYTFGSPQRPKQINNLDIIQESFTKQLSGEIINFAPYLSMDKNNFIGWPGLMSLDGYSLYDKLDKKKDFISDLTTFTEYIKDNHPNQNGHNKIANIILNHINTNI